MPICALDEQLEEHTDSYTKKLLTAIKQTINIVYGTQALGDDKEYTYISVKWCSTICTAKFKDSSCFQYNLQMSFYLYHKCKAEKGEFTVKRDDPMTFPPGNKWKVAVVKFIGPGAYGSHFWWADNRFVLCSDIVCNSYMDGKHVRLLSSFQRNDGWYFIWFIFNLNQRKLDKLMLAG